MGTANEAFGAVGPGRGQTLTEKGCSSKPKRLRPRKRKPWGRKKINKGGRGAVEWAAEKERKPGLRREQALVKKT